MKNVLIKKAHHKYTIKAGEDLYNVERLRKRWFINDERKKNEMVQYYDSFTEVLDFTFGLTYFYYLDISLDSDKLVLTQILSPETIEMPSDLNNL